MWILKSIDVVRWIWTLGCSYVLLNPILFCQKMVSFGDTTLWWGSNDSQHTDPLSTLNILNFHTKGQEPWSSGYGRRLMFQRLWVQIPAPYTGWTFFYLPICCKNYYVCLKRRKQMKKRPGLAHFFKKNSFPRLGKVWFIPKFLEFLTIFKKNWPMYRYFTS